jgi:hypothetical protein
MNIMFSRALILLAAALLAATGCGDGGDDQAAAGSRAADGSPVSDRTGSASGAKDRFMERANASCRQTRKQIQEEVQAILAAGTAEPKAAVRRAIESVVAPGLRSEIGAVRALEPPSQDADRVQAILASIEQAVREAQADPAEFTSRLRPFVRPEKLANEYGLTACGRI